MRPADHRRRRRRRAPDPSSVRNGAAARSTALANRHDAELGLGGAVLASSAYSSRRADEVEEPREDEAVLEDEALGVRLTVGVARLADELNEPHPAATDTQRSTDTALTGAQLRRKLTAMPRRPHQSWTTDDRPVMLHAVLGWLRRKRPAQARAPSGPSNPRNSPIELASLLYGSAYGSGPSRVRRHSLKVLRVVSGSLRTTLLMHEHRNEAGRSEPRSRCSFRLTSARSRSRSLAAPGATN